MRTWEANDPDFGRPIAAPLDQCAELLGVDLATVCELAVKVEPYLRADGTRIWSLMQLERQLRPASLVVEASPGRSPAASRTYGDRLWPFHFPTHRYGVY